VELGFQFHRGLCEASDNPFLLEFFDMISTQVRLALQLDSIEYLRHSDLGDYVDAHNELLVVIEAGDEYAASAALERHVLDGVGDLLTRLAADDDEAVQDLKPKVLGPEDRAFPPAHR
jgi:DNA-binding GntR family transcriptional regulator